MSEIITNAKTVRVTAQETYIKWLNSHNPYRTAPWLVETFSIVNDGNEFSLFFMPGFVSAESNNNGWQIGDLRVLVTQQAEFPVAPYTNYSRDEATRYSPSAVSDPTFEGGDNVDWVSYADVTPEALDDMVTYWRLRIKHMLY